MDISALKTSVGFGDSANIEQTVPRTQFVINVPTATTGNVTDKLVTAPIDDKVNKKPVNLHDVTQITESINRFIEAMDANIRFTVHQKTNELMVQVIDQTNNKVLKEFPPHEFLDTMAAIREYVGILLDKKI
ncbi:flagellar protein FlaG [Desulfosporosinus sp. Sb-LF]|nr:flagellar protein FlaG [Desulfosporosinus sp. Sb-LF]